MVEHPQPLTVHRPYLDYAQALAFDDRQELLWVGNQEGRIKSFVVPPFAPYTSFRGHDSTVMQMVMDNRFMSGVVSLAYDGVRVTSRRGIVKWALTLYDKPSLMNLHAMTFTSVRPTHELLVAGHQPKMVLLNIDRGSVIREIDAETPDVSVLRRSATHVIVGTTSGQIRFKDPRTLFSVHATTAHSESLSDIAVCGDYVITSGYSNSQGTMYLDPFLKVYDVRTMSAMSAIPSAAHFLKCVPNSTSDFLGVTHEGDVYRGSVKDMSFVQKAQLTTEGYVTAVDIASSSSMLAFTTSVGEVHVWSGDNTEPRVNEESDPIEVPSMHVPPDVTITETTPLSVIGMPYYNERLMSGNWPPTMFFDVGQPAPDIDPAILATVKMNEFVGYAPKPSHIRRNQVRYGQKPVSEDSDHLFISARSKSVEIKYSKYGVEDFDFAYVVSLGIHFNKTPFAGLETHLANCYANPLLQALYFASDFRVIAEAHCLGSCQRDICLLCEAGFLFKMLRVGQGAHCRASNFLSAFAHLPQGALLESGAAEVHYSRLIQALCPFVLEQFHKEHFSVVAGRSVDSAPGAMSSPIEQIFSLRANVVQVCAGCQTSTTRTKDVFSVDLQYSPSAPNARTSNTLPELLQSSLGLQQSFKAWCETCSKYQNTTQSRNVVELPRMLTISCTSSLQNQIEVWRAKAAPNSGTKRRFLPQRLMITLNGDVCSVSDASVQAESSAGEGGSVAEYQLMSVISEVQVRKERSHLVAEINVSCDAEDSEWYLFNDFLVRPVSFDEVTQLPEWKVPALVHYRMVQKTEATTPLSEPEPLDLSLLSSDYSLSDAPLPASTKLLTPQELDAAQAGHGFLCAIDAEFVSLSEEEAEIRSNGTKDVGPDESSPFIDDYILSLEPVQNYLTEFSGIVEGDLDPATSKHHLVSLKTVYTKMRLLVDIGCKFIGHGLKQDFRIINILVPPEQILDTVDIYFIKSMQRKLSLRFLSWYVLGIEIQQESHDSIEDARTALLLYRRHLELVEQGKWAEKLEEIYEVGRRYHYKPPAPGQVLGGVSVSSSAPTSTTASDAKE
ncbi:poly(A)-specific ribonuclease [Sorochytrium milnesiophthora]